MQQLLVLHTSLNGADSLSSALARDYAQRWARRTGGQVIERDLAANPVAHLTAERFAAFAVPAAERSPAEEEQVAESDELIAELKAADELVVALPMYNFHVPSTFKAWIDHVARAGETFRYTTDGPVGLLTTRRATVVATRGGRYVGTALDTQTDYVTDVLAFLGIDDTRFVHVEGTAMGDEARAEAIAGARSQLDLAPSMAA